VLPAQTYVKGFLRTYAEYLGLDGQLYVDEFNSRFVAGGGAHEPHIARRSTARPQRRNRRLETSVVLVALGLIAIVTVILISAFKSGGSPQVVKPPAHRVSPRARAAPALLTVVAVRGSTHLVAHTGSANGGVAYEGTIQTGDPAVAIRGRRLWVQIDTPENLKIRIRGRLVHVPGLKPAQIVVTPTGWHRA
jgi:hypothetical protein